MGERPRPGRRQALLLLSGGAGALLLASCGVNSPASEPTKVASSPTPQEAKLPVPERMFVDERAQKAADKFRIKPGDYFMFAPEMLKNLDSFLIADLLPIFPPAVLRHQAVMRRVQGETGVPINVLAEIMTIESAGKVHAVSGADAQGLVQVMPFHFPKEMRSNPDAMHEPYTNLTTGMTYLMRDCLPPAKEGLRGKYSPSHVSVYARAMAAYNGGPSAADKDFNKLEFESQKYADFFIGMALDAQIAQELRSNGLSDPEIARAMSSYENNGRNYALNDHAINVGFENYDELRPALIELSSPVVGYNYATGQFHNELGAKLYKSYRTYLETPSEHYKLPISPGLRKWNAMGGINLFSQIPANMDPQAWAAIGTR